MRTIFGLALLVLVATPVGGAITVYRGPVTDPFTGQDGRLTARVRTTGAELRARLRCRGVCVVRRGRITAAYDAAASSVVGTLRDAARGRTCEFRGYLYLRFFQDDIDCAPRQIPQVPGARGREPAAGTHLRAVLDDGLRGRPDEGPGWGDRSDHSMTRSPRSSIPSSATITAPPGTRRVSPAGTWRRSTRSSLPAQASAR
jgi:hypothetical protein